MERYLVDQFATLEGVASVRINGARRYAMRVWLSRENLAARQLTVADIENALLRENVELPAGRIESTRARVHAAHRHRPAHRGRFPQPRRRAAAPMAIWCGSAKSPRCAWPPTTSAACRAPTAPSACRWRSFRSRRRTCCDVAARVQEAARSRSSPRCPRTCSVEVNIDNGVFIAASIKNVVFALVRDADARARRDLPVPGHAARDADSGGDDPGLDHRRRASSCWRSAIRSTR